MLRLIRRLAIAVVLAFLALCLLVVAAFAFVLYYPQLGRMNDFRELRQSTTLSGTNYALELIGNDVRFRNTVTQSLYVTGLSSLPDDPLLYTLLRHRDNTYLIVGSDHEDGNIGGFWFDIFNITGEPYIVDDRGVLPHLSCTYPRLDGDALLFETAHQCDFYPFFVRDQLFYTVRLK